MLHYAQIGDIVGILKSFFWFGGLTFDCHFIMLFKNIILNLTYKWVYLKVCSKYYLLSF